MRLRLPQSPLTPQTVGLFISDCDVKLNRQLPLSTTPFWTLARKCMRATNKVLTNGDINSTTHFFNYIMSNERRFA
jgi:hypothetical protein